MKSGAWAAQFPGLHPGYELLKVVAKDIASYERFLRDHLLQRPHVHEAHSHIAMSEVKRTTELPLD